MPDFSFTDLLSDLSINVSHETIEKLNLYDKLLLKWQKAINLIGPATIDERAERHFLDSAQMITHIPNKDIRLVDLGSGAGFPGLVLAILGVKDVHLVESDIRKATFLRTVSRETNTPVTIHDQRIESCQIDNIDLVTARALAPLTDLLTHTHHLAGDGKIPDALFLKGAASDAEQEKAEKRWTFDIEEINSLTDPEGRILSLKNIAKK